MRSRRTAGRHLHDDRLFAFGRFAHLRLNEMKRTALIVPLLMAGACDTTMSAGADTAPAGGGGVAPTAGVALALLPPNQGGATAAASGTLALRGRCLVLESGSEVTQLAFATAEARWDDSSRALRVGTRSFPLGTRVEFGGGEFAGYADALPWLRTPVPECRGRFWIVSSISRG